MVEPTAYDLQQDAEINELKSLITAEHEQPQGAEYSFPIANQGITQEQFRVMNTAQGKGIIHRGGSPYMLTWPEGGETQANQTNQMVLTVSAGTGTAEAVIHGFFHRLTQNIPIPLPAVTTTTVYHVCITYDPRLFKTTPLKIEVYPGEPPTSNGRDHLVLWRVTRNPNELLSQAVREVVRPIISPTFYVNGYNHLPDPDSVPNGTIANVAGSGLYSAIASVGWRDMLGHLAPKAGPWTNCSLLHNWEHYSTFGSVQARLNQGMVEMRGAMRYGNFTADRTVVQLPAGHFPSRQRPLTAHFTDTGFDIRALPDGAIQFFGANGPANWVSFEGVRFSL